MRTTTARSMIVSGRLPIPAIAAGAYTRNLVRFAVTPVISTPPTVADLPWPSSRGTRASPRHHPPGRRATGRRGAAATGVPRVGAPAVGRTLPPAVVWTPRGGRPAAGGTAPPPARRKRRVDAGTPPGAAATG